MRRRNPSESEIRLLMKLAKKGKGILDLDLAQQALKTTGWRFQSRVQALGMERDDVQRRIERRLQICGGYFSIEQGALLFWDSSKAECARRLLSTEMQIVESPPDDPEIGEIYATSPGEVITRPGGRIVVPTQIWRGGVRWTVTAPDGARKDFDVSDAGPVNLGPLWTFLYKHGADKQAEALLAQSPELVADVGRTQAERRRIEMQRRSLPEIATVFRDVTDARYQSVIAYLEAMFEHVMQHALELQAAGSTRIPWQKIPGGYEAQRMLDFSYATGYQPKPDHAKIAHALAVRAADEARESFVFKNTARISEIAKRKGASPEAKLLYIGSGYDSEIRFSFSDGSAFTLRNKTIWKRSSGGVTFAQFPTTFHDVVLPGGKKMASPSEARMLDIFARATKENPTRRPSSHYRAIADRLVRG